MSLRLAVFPNDPLVRAVEKGEIKPRYYNPDDLFDEVHFFTFADEDVAPEAVQVMAGRARVGVHPLGVMSLARFPLAFRRAREAVAAVGPDVVRAYNPRQVGAPAVYAARRLGVPSVTSTHNDFPRERQYQPDLRRRLCWFLEGYCYRRATVSVGVTAHVAAYARRRGARRVEVIYNRVYASAMDPKPSVEAAPRTVLCVGRLDPQKRQEVVLRAVAARLALRLHLVGQGGRDGELKRLAEDLGCADRVTFTPRVEHGAMPAVYREADLFAIATDYEGFCIPVLEAMAAGLPCVVCDTPPLPEVLGGCGLVVWRNPVAFGEAFDRLAADPSLRCRLAAKARERALALDGAVMEGREAALYRSLLDETTPAGEGVSSTR